MSRRFKTQIFVLFFFLPTFFLQCKKTELKITETILCDRFNSSGECSEPLSKNHTYDITFPISKNITTWEKFGNYMYFTTRQTPGFILRFNRNFSPKEKKELYDSFKATYQFSDSKGEMEGLEIGDNFIGVFNYLGSMVKKKAREAKLENVYPYPNLIFPATLNLYYSSTLIKGEIDMTVNINLKYIP